MTRTAEILGSEYDATAQLPEQLEHYEPKKSLALAALKQAEAAGDAATVEVMYWELGLLALWLSPTRGASPYVGGTYETYAEAYRISESTVAYGRERANETRDVILKLHYLTFVLLRSEPRGRMWMELQREILASYREYVSGCLHGSKNAPTFPLGLSIAAALTASGPLMARPGVIRRDEYAEWAQWILGLAEESLTFPQEAKREYLRYRWIADYLEHLTELPASVASPSLQEKALGLLSDAAAFYEANPLAYRGRGAIRVAEAEAELRKHWGEEGEKPLERKVRRSFAALQRRAEFFQKHSTGFLAAGAFREARRLVEQQRRFFTDDDIAYLQQAEQVAISRGLEAGELVPIGDAVEIPVEHMDFTQDSPEATVEALAESSVAALPARDEIAEAIRARNRDSEDGTEERDPEDGTKGVAGTKRLAMLPRSVIGPGKVVGESTSAERNLTLDIEEEALMRARVIGLIVSITAVRAAASVGLSADHLVAPLAPLALDEGALTFIRRGCERLIAQDFISATHILVLRVEDVLRQHLRSLGVDTTELKVDESSGTSRTDDVSFGKLMKLKLRDGRSLRDYLGGDLWSHLHSVLNSQTGLNLRNDFAHGQARPQHCTAEIAGLVLALLYQLAHAIQGASEAASMTGA